MAFDENKVDEVVATALKLANQSFVISVEDHYAGYWDELGFSVFLKEDATDSDIIHLRNQLLSYLNSVLPKGNPYFSWVVGFRRKKETIEVIVPGDLLRSTDDVLYSLGVTQLKF